MGSPLPSRDEVKTQVGTSLTSLRSYVFTMFPFFVVRRFRDAFCLDLSATFRVYGLFASKTHVRLAIRVVVNANASSWLNVRIDFARVHIESKPQEIDPLHIFHVGVMYHGPLSVFQQASSSTEALHNSVFDFHCPDKVFDAYVRSIDWW